MKNKGHKNLEKSKGRFGDLDKEDLTEISKRGGIASGKARRERASIKKSIERFLNYQPTTKERENFKDLVDDYEELTYADVIALTAIRSAVSKASKGDIKILEFLRDTAGEKPVSTLQGNLDLSNRAEVVITLPDNNRGDIPYEPPFGAD